MKIAIRQNELYKECDWNEYFKKDIVNIYGEIIESKKDLSLSPYNYQIIEIDDNLVDSICFDDFELIANKYKLNFSKYKTRIDNEKKR